MGEEAISAIYTESTQPGQVCSCQTINQVFSYVFTCGPWKYSEFKESVPTPVIQCEATTLKLAEPQDNTVTKGIFTFSCFYFENVMLKLWH